MTIRDRIFDKLDELNMTQKEFSEKTGIAQSTVSDWRKKRTNPTDGLIIEK
jgi:transcriptional regulator with XRE-family HTH domain